MSSRSSSSLSSSTSSYDNHYTEISDIQKESPTLHSPHTDPEDSRISTGNETATGSFPVEITAPGTGQVTESTQYEIIDIDGDQQNDNEGGNNEDATDGVVLRRNRGNAGENSGKRSSFKKQARLSRMLQNIESSDDDDELYTFASIPQQSLKTRLTDPAIYQHDQISSQLAVSSAPVSLPMSTAQDAEEIVGDSIKMKELSKIVNPSVLSEVKAHLRKVTRQSLEVPTSIPISEPSPAKLWEMRRQKQNDKVLLNKAQAAKIKAGWKIRQCLESLPDGETVNTFYFTLVKRSMLREVEALFSHAKVTNNNGFNKNYRDVDDKSALTIAIDNKDEAMMSKLMEHGVDLGYSIFHVIAADFMEGLKLIMLYNPCIDKKIEDENHYFQIGMTPMILAAHNNNYQMLWLLHEYSHRLTEPKHWSEGIHDAWASSNERRMICLARSQPAYITLLTEINHMNPMTYCLKEIKMLKECESHEHEFSGFYKDIITQLEDYMCSLLDCVCSSEELSDLFQFERPPAKEKRTQQLLTYIDGATTQRWQLGNRFELLERASRENLVRFVTHQQSQLALSYLRYRSLPFLKNNFFAITIGLLFPVLSIFYLCAPNSAIGGIITLPVVSFNCHMMSDFAFAFVLLLKIAIRDSTSDRLGEPLTALEWLIMLWILGKWIQEMQECMNRGMKAYFSDNWNYTDITLLLLFTISLFIRVFDVIYNRNSEQSPRYLWGPFEPRLIGEGLQAWGYVFVFIRILGLTRVDRNLGPLQISLGKMLGDIVRFLCLFSLVVGAFAFGLSDLYWYYGTREGGRMFCERNSTSSENGTVTDCAAKKTAFSSMPNSIVSLFWALFGLFELDSLSLGGKHVYTETVGRTLVATYHVVAIIVMLNMLIAMMSNSYNATSEDEETAWKFHRTAVWIRFIRREVIRPPPMNLFPNPWRLNENIRRLKNFCRSLCPTDGPLTEDVYDEQGRRKNRSQTMNNRIDFDPELSSANSTIKTATSDGKQNSKQTDEKTTGCFGKTKKSKDKSELIERETSFDGNEKPRILISAPNSAPGSRRPSIRRPVPGFSPAVLKGVKEKLRQNFRANKPKGIMEKLVKRYKLKHLTNK